MTSTVSVHPDAGSLAAAVATALLDRLATAQAVGGVPAVVLTGGTIADEIHRELARLARDAAVDWSRVDVWWGDERYVAGDSPDRNARQAREALLEHVPVDPARVHEMPDASYGDVEDAAAAYSEQVRAEGTGAFDVVMLGVGPDGHVASLFPGFPQLDVDDRVAVAVSDSPKPPPERISLTFGALNRTREVWLLVSGAEKAPAVARALAAEGSVTETPARAVRGTDATVWWLDEAAAAGLP